MCMVSELCVIYNLSFLYFAPFFKVFSYCEINLYKTGKVKVKQENQEELDVADVSQSRKAQTRYAATLTRSVKFHHIAIKYYILIQYQHKVYSHWA